MAKEIETYRVCGWFKDGEIMHSKGIFNLSSVEKRKKIDDLALATAILHDDNGYLLREGDLTFYEDYCEPQEGETEVFIIAPRHPEELYLPFEPTYFLSWQEAEKRMFWKQEKIPQKILQGVIHWREPSAEVVRLSIVFKGNVSEFKPMEGCVYYFARECRLTPRITIKRGDIYRYTNGEWIRYKGYKV